MKKLERNKSEMIRVFSSVANELPEEAKEILSSEMGDLKVSARDSWELYLNRVGIERPEYKYDLFRKRFVELYRRKAVFTLEKIKENRNKNKEFFITNDLFWQEFDCLWKFSPIVKRKMFNAGVRAEKSVWLFSKKMKRSLVDIWRNIEKVGIEGWAHTKIAIGLANKKKEVKWK